MRSCSHFVFVVFGPSTTRLAPSSDLWPMCITMPRRPRRIRRSPVKGEKPLPGGELRSRDQIAAAGQKRPDPTSPRAVQVRWLQQACRPVFRQEGGLTPAGGPAVEPVTSHERLVGFTDQRRQDVRGGSRRFRRRASKRRPAGRRGQSGKRRQEEGAGTPGCAAPAGDRQ